MIHEECKLRQTTPSFYSCPFSEDISAVFIEPDSGLQFTNVLLSSPYLAQCWGLLEDRRQHREAFSRPSFQQFHRTKARAQCSGASGKGIQRKEEQMASGGLGRRTLPQLSHLFMPTSPDSHHHTVAPLRAQPCHRKSRTQQPLGLQQAHRPLCQDTLLLSLHSANPLVIRWTLLKHTSLSPLLFKHCGAQLGTKFSVGIQGGSCWSNLKLPLQPSSSSSPFTREHPNWKNVFFSTALSFSTYQRTIFSSSPIIYASSYTSFLTAFLSTKTNGSVSSFEFHSPFYSSQNIDLRQPDSITMFNWSLTYIQSSVVILSEF